MTRLEQKAKLKLFEESILLKLAYKKKKKKFF